MATDALDVLDFWWRAGSEKWFSSDPRFDTACREGFQDSLEAAAAGTLDAWCETPHGALALILLLDQMSRNIFRDTPRMFATDAQALAIAEQAIDNGFDRAFPLIERRFVYMPFMHAEDLSHQERCIDLCRALGDKEGYRYALIHMDPIRRFGRFPHRNRILGRESTPAEIAYMETGGFSG